MVGWTVTSVRKENASPAGDWFDRKAGNPRQTPRQLQRSHGPAKDCSCTATDGDAGGKPSALQESVPCAPAVAVLGLTHSTWMPKYALRFGPWDNTVSNTKTTHKLRCGSQGWLVFLDDIFVNTNLGTIDCKPKDRQEQELLNKRMRICWAGKPHKCPSEYRGCYAQMGL